MTQHQINQEASRLYNAHKRGEPLPEVSEKAKVKARALFKLKRGWPNARFGWYDETC